MLETTLPAPTRAASVAAVMRSPEMADAVRRLEGARTTGRRGYGARALLGAAVAKVVYGLDAWTRTVGLLAEHRELRRAIGLKGPEQVPSAAACYRFLARLRREPEVLAELRAGVQRALLELLPAYGTDAALDGSAMTAYSNGQRYVRRGGALRRISDPDAAWGHQGATGTRASGSVFGYRLHALVCTATELPVAWATTTATDWEPGRVG